MGRSKTIVIRDRRAAELVIANKEKVKRADELVIALEFRIAATVFEPQEGMMITDANKIIIRVNKAFTSITGYNAEEAIGHNPRILSRGDMMQRFMRQCGKK